MKGVLVIKGGPGSGNFDHEGRPGLVGGSAPSAVATSSDSYRHLSPLKSRILVGKWGVSNEYSMEEAAAVLSKCEDGKGTLNWAEFIDNAYNWTDAESGIEARVDEVKVKGWLVNVHGYLYKDGINIGWFRRLINDDGSIEHDHLSIDPRYQGSGFGTRFLEHCEYIYKDQGINRITVFADMSIGGYTWARLGFDFKGGDGPPTTDWITAFTDKWSNRYPNDPPPDISNAHAYELAVLTGPDGYHFGKEALLGTDWSGVKYMDPNNATWIVGQVYYSYKSIK